jgi:hypothetical protein
MSGKSEIYTWRVSPAMKEALEEAARSTNRSVASLLDEIVAVRLETVGKITAAEMATQRRLHARAARFAGRFSGANPARSTDAAALVRARLAGRRARAR